MNIALGTESPALTGSQRSQPAPPQGAPLELQPTQAAHLLVLRLGQQLMLRVSEGPLWLTMDGRLDDEVLQAGEQALLRGPGRYRLGTFGAGRTVLTLQRLD